MTFWQDPHPGNHKARETRSTRGSINLRKEHIMLRMFLTITMLAALIAQPARGAAMSPHSADGLVPDQNPVTFGPIPTQYLTEGGESLTLDLSTYVSGTTSGMLMFSATSSNTALVTVSLIGNRLTIEPVASGNAQIEVTLDLTVDIVVSFDVVVLSESPWSVSDTGHVYRLDGNVGIGVDDPDERLVVDGLIKAEEIHMDEVTPADYVFDEDYDLMSLDALKEHIRAHGHLPGIAPGAQMEAEGVSVGRMQTRLLEKVEELMLYTIDQHRTLSSQRKVIDAQEQQLARQERYIESLEQRLSELEKRH